MSRDNAGRAYLALRLAIFFVPFFAIIALDHAGESPFKEYLSWTLVDLLATGFVTMPAILYGYHNRHHIGTSDVEKSYDFNHAHRRRSRRSHDTGLV